MLDSEQKNWKKCRLGELITFKYGASLTKAKRRPGDILVYSSAGVVDCHNEPLVSHRSIVIGRKGSVGTVYLTNGPFFAIDTTFYIEPKVKLDWVWLKELLISLDLKSLNEATGVPGLNRDRAYSVEVQLPPIREQTCIAEILATWDRAIETTEALLDASRALKRALMQSLITGKRRFPEFKGQVWREVDLEAVANIIVSNVDKKSNDGEHPIRLCNYTDVYKCDTIDPSQDFMRATATPAQIKKFGLKAGDVVITKDSETADDIAMPTYVRETADDLVCGYHLAIVRPRFEIDGQFLKFFFELPHTRYYFGTRANGATRFGLTIGGIQGAKLKLPPLEEQRRIASVIVESEIEIAAISADIEKLRTEKKVLMQQLLTGKRRVSI